MKTHQMTEGPIARTILLYSIPLILGNLLQQLYNAADSLIVGNFVGDRALAAVGASGNLIFVLIALYLGASSGAGIIIAQLYGSRDRERLGIAVHTTITLALILGTVIMIAGIFVAPALLSVLGTPTEVMPQAILYLRIFFGGMIFNVVYNMAAGILNAVGNSRRSLVYLGVASITNILLDLLLVAGMKLGIAGAAIATDLSQLLSAILVLRFLQKTSEDYRVSIKDLHLNVPMAVRIMQVGIPTAIQNAVIGLSNLFIQAGVNSYGTAAVAGFTAYMKVDGFNIMPIMSFSLAATTFTGQNLGAGKCDRVKKGMRTVVLMGLIYTACMTGIMLLFAKSIIGWFSNDPEVIAYGVIAVWSLAPFYTLLSLIHDLAGTIRGTGHTVEPMLIILFSLCLFRIFWIHLIAPRFGSIWGVLYTYPSSFLVGAILMSLYAWKGRWKTALNVEET